MGGTWQRRMYSAFASLRVPIKAILTASLEIRGEASFFVPIAERRHGIDCALFLFRELNKGTKGKGNEAVGDTAQDTVVLSEDSV